MFANIQHSGKPVYEGVSIGGGTINLAQAAHAPMHSDQASQI